MNSICTEQCLNGYWDFLPVCGDSGRGHTPPAAIPSGGWLEGAMLVPGSWTRGEDAPGFADLGNKPWTAWRLFDNYGHPPEWQKMDSAWYRRGFTMAAVAPDRRYLLHFGGVLREAWVFVNGIEVGHSENGILPLECDVTRAVAGGANTLHVYATDYRRNAEGKTYTPYGADQMLAQKGIWQDVTLKTVPAVRVHDVTIRTSVRENRLTVIAELVNQGESVVTTVPHFAVNRDGVAELAFATEAVSLAPGESRLVTMTHPWSDYRPWSHHDPCLYHLETRLEGAATILDRHSQRFGFREVWIEGPDLMLNGAPVHLAGDWSHRLTLESLTDDYFRKWFGMLKDCHMNYVRTHTYPHPVNMLELADEMGILISLEAGWHFGFGFALDEEALWQGALRHVREIVRRDKNHPSIILWSVGNEVRWSGNQQAIIRNVPRLRHLYEQLDPTRPAYHDGDSSLWDERTQPLLSRHYGLECTGDGWWDQRQPLHVGEIGKWHYGQPIDNCIWGDDGVFASFRECHLAVARECADQIGQARANGVCCLFPWNLSGLDNFRPWAEERHFEVDDPESPGIKILRTAPHGSEFAWWEDGKGYVPGVSFEPIRHALRPVAVLVREHLGHTFADRPVEHTVTVVNDTDAAIRGELMVRFVNAAMPADVLWEHREPVVVAPGRRHRVKLAIMIPSIDEDADGIVETLLNTENSYREADRHRRPLKIVAAARRSEPWLVPAVTLLGDAALADLLCRHGMAVRRIDRLDELEPQCGALLLMGPGTVVAGSRQNLQLRSFLQSGGRAVILEQSCSIMPGLDLELKPAERCHLRDGGDSLLAGFRADDFSFWGSDPYGRSDSDAWVTIKPYRKSDLPGATALLHSGQGDFGSDGLYWSPLIRARVGDGLLIASQLRIGEKRSTHPVALGLLRRFLEYATAWESPVVSPVAALGATATACLDRLGVIQPPDASGLLIADADALDARQGGRLAAAVCDGATVVVQGVDDASAARLSAALGIPLETVDLGPQYLLLRRGDDPLLAGISHQETCWLEKMQYSKPCRRNRLMTKRLLRCAGAEELLVSEYDTCWREFFFDGACSERLRMPVVSHLLGDIPREHAAGLLRLRLGKGTVLLSQMPWPQDDEHQVARCFWTQLLTNLGAAFRATILDGDGVRPGSMRSGGYPVEIGALCDPDEETLAEILRVGRPTEYRIHNHALVHGFDWHAGLYDDGVFRLDDGEQPRRVVLAFQIHAGRPRALRYAEDGLPDPTEQTLCDLKGSGVVHPFVNGRAFDPVELGAGGRGVIPDIDLDMNWNTVILLWEPAVGWLRIGWRDRQRNPEVEFAFMFKNTQFLSGAVHV